MLGETEVQDPRVASQAVLHDGLNTETFLLGGRSSVVIECGNGGRECRRVLHTKSSLFAIGGTGSGGIILCGRAGRIIRSEDGEREWVKGKSGTRAELNGVSIAGKGRSAIGLIVGEEGVILGSTDGGNTWQKLAHPLGPLSLTKIAVLGPSDAVLTSSTGIYPVEIVL